jgi:hypothetical protein
MPSFTIPAVNIHITAGPQHVELCTGSACCVCSFPSTSKNIAILTVGSDNKFSLARSTVDLDGTPTSQASKLDPGMAFRFTAPGQSPADPVGLVQQTTASEQHVSLHQHVCTQYVSLQNMLHGFCTGAPFVLDSHTLEDGQHLRVSYTLGENAKDTSSVCTTALTQLQLHIKTLEMAHGARLLSAENLVQIVHQGRSDRQTKIQQTTHALFGAGGPASWNLRATRAAPGLDIDMAMSDQIRLGGMQANLPYYTQKLAVNLGGMLAGITQRFNGHLASEVSTSAALQLWDQASTDNQKKLEYMGCVEKGTVFTSAYLSDPSWSLQDGKLQISKETVGEDQEVLGGTAVENIINFQTRGASMNFGDCEDTAASNAQQLSLMQMPRTQLSCALTTALEKIPEQFAKSAAASDYTHLTPQILSLAMMICDAYSCKEKTPIASVQTREQMFTCMKTNMQTTSPTTVHSTTAALVASAPKLDCSMQTGLQLSNDASDVKKYTEQWQTNINAGDPKQQQWMGHSACAQVETIPVCEHNGVILSFVKGLNLLEGTSCAYKLKGVNTTVKMNMLLDRQNELRQNVQGQLDKIGKPLSTVMAMNIGGTVLASELRTALHEQGSMLNVNAGQVYKLNSTPHESCVDGTFYRCLVTAGKLECATLDLNTNILYPGIALDVQQIPKTLNIAMEATMTARETEACMLLGTLMSVGRMSAGMTAKTSGNLTPLMLRQALTSKLVVTGPQNTQLVTLQAQSAVQIIDVSTVMGCVLKDIKSDDKCTDSQISLQTHAQLVASTTAKIYGLNTTIEFGPFVNSMMLSVQAQKNTADTAA